MLFTSILGGLVFNLNYCLKPNPHHYICYIVTKRQERVLIFHLFLEQTLVHVYQNLKLILCSRAI